MLGPVQCFTCGNVLGDKHLFYARKLAEKLARLKDATPGQHHDGRDVAMGDVLDAMGLDLYCCRTVMMTSVDLTGVVR